MLTSFVRTIRFYRTSAGKCPVEEFLDSLPDGHAQKVAWVLRRIESVDPDRWFFEETTENPTAGNRVG